MLIRTKLLPPRQAIDMLPRSGLTARLTARDVPPLVIVNSPPGYGKSTLLVQCFGIWRAQGVAAAWYSADEGNLEREQFFAYLMAALHAAGLPLPYSADAIRTGLPGLIGDQAARAVVLALEASEEPVRLVIDDYHRVASRETDAFLDYVVSRLPQHASIFLSTRGDTGLAVASLRARGMVWTLDQRDLSFSGDEIRELLSPELSGAALDVEAVLGKTEGWPAALQLMRIWAQGRNDDFPIDGLTRRSSDLANYLAEQVFADLPDTLRSFLVETSITRQLSAELADAITGRLCGRTSLDRLERINFLLTPLDEQREWYRYHPLLAEYLQDMLRAGRPQDEPILHRRAADWYAQAGNLTDALYHAERIGDPDAPIAILEAAGGWRVGLRGGLPLLRGLREIPLGQPERHPRVWLGQVYLAGQEGRVGEARVLLDQLVRKLEDGWSIDDPSLRCEILGNDIVTRIYEDAPIPEDYEGVIAGLLAQPDLGTTESALAIQLLCLIHFERGDEAKCRAYGEQALRLAVANGLTHAATYLYLYLGLSQLRQGRRPEAEIFFRRALEYAVRNFGEGSALVALSQILLARTHYLAERLGTAQQWIESALPTVEAGEGWFDIYHAAYGSLAWIAAADGDWIMVEQILERAMRTARQRNLGRLARAMAVVRLRIALWSGELDRISSASGQLDDVSAGDTRPDPDLDCAADVARVGADMAMGADISAERLAALRCRAQSSGSAIREMEVDLLAATLAARQGRDADAIMMTRRLVGMVTSEELGSIVNEFGSALLGPVIALCRARFESFSPTERQYLTHLSSRLSRPDAVATPPRASEIVVTPREVDVLRALADGLSSKEIAQRLRVAESTVKTHRINLYRKLNVTIRSKAIAAARAHGLL